MSDISIETNGTSSIRFWGKGRKERVTPIWKSTAAFIDSYIKLQNLNRDNRLLSNNRKGNLTRSGIGQRITTITEKAAELSPSLNKKNVTPHTFRHSAAMNLRQAGVDISTIAIWLGHESIETTHKYMVADIEIKRQAMEKLDETSNSSFNYFVQSGLSLGIYWLGSKLVNNIAIPLNGSISEIVTAIGERADLLGDVVAFNSYALYVVMSFVLLLAIFMLLPRAQAMALIH